MKEIRPITDTDDIREIVDFATTDLRRIYRLKNGADDSSGTDQDSVFEFLVAIDDNLPVGVIEYCDKGNSLYVRGLAVHPKWRKRGFATKLIQEVEQIAIQSGFSSVLFETIKETENPKFFNNLGYNIVHESHAVRFEGTDGNPVTIVAMVRDLA